MGLLRLCCGFWVGIDGSSVMKHGRSFDLEMSSVDWYVFSGCRTFFLSFAKRAAKPSVGRLRKIDRLI